MTRQQQVFDRFNDLATVDNQGTVPAAVQTLSGNCVFQTGPVDGFLQLTAQANSEFGTLVIDDFNGNSAVGGFTASMKAQLVGGNPADGWSFSWGNGITPVQVYGGLESGLGNDLRVGFITCAGSGRSIRVNWRGAALANVAVPIELLQTPADTFEEVLIRVTPATSTSDALLDVAQDGVLVIRSGLDTPGWRFRFTRWNDRMANRLRWMQALPVHYPTAESLTTTLTAAGLTGTLQPLHGHTPFNNWLAVFRRA